MKSWEEKLWAFKMTSWEEKFWHWIDHRNRPTAEIDLNTDALERVVEESIRENGSENSDLESLCSRYKCEAGMSCRTSIMVDPIIVLDFHDPRLYTLFMLRYGHML